MSEEAVRGAGPEDNRPFNHDPFRYAQILAADRRGEDWRPIARILLGVDAEIDEAAADAAWRRELRAAKLYWLGPGAAGPVE